MYTTLICLFNFLKENAHRQYHLSKDQYWALRHTEWSYLIIRRQFKPSKSWVSRFAYVRRVDVNPTTNVARCSCLFFERHGFPCRHLYILLQQPTTTDFDVRWWLAYGAYYGEKGKFCFSALRLLVLVDLFRSFYTLCMQRQWRIYKNGRFLEAQRSRRSLVPRVLAGSRWRFNRAATRGRSAGLKCHYLL